MCGRLMYHKGRTVPGDYLNFTDRDHKIISGKWGWGKGGPLQYNARIESLRSTYKGWIEKRGILEVDGFYENNFFFCFNDGSILLPVIYDKDYDFLIMTKVAKAPVFPIHDRQPIILDKEGAEMWLEKGQMIQAKEFLSKSKAA